MSLKDTIKGAREEAAASGSPFGRAEASAKDEQTQAAPSGDQGFVRRSAARSKPSREASAGIRKVAANGKAKSTANMTKEERKAEKRRERENEDRRYNVSQMILEENEEYQHCNKIWKRYLIAGGVCIGIAIITYLAVNSQGAAVPAWVPVVSIITLIASYLIVIAGFIYDWRHIRPLRQNADKRAASMSDKKIKAVLNKGSVK